MIENKYAHVSIIVGKGERRKTPEGCYAHMFKMDFLLNVGVNSSDTMNKGSIFSLSEITVSSQYRVISQSGHYCSTRYTLLQCSSIERTSDDNRSSSSSSSSSSTAVVCERNLDATNAVVCI